MSKSIRTDLDAIHRSVLTAFTPLSRAARRTGLALYRLLAETGPVLPEQLAAMLDTTPAEIIKLLDEPGLRCQQLLDDSKRIIGFGGLTLMPTTHRLQIGARQMFTWCAWDALFIPGLLRATTARVESTCPASGEIVRLTVTPSGALALGAGEPVVSFTLPDANDCAESAERSITCFCSHVHLLASYNAGAVWVAERDEVFLLSLADAFELGRRYSAARFEIGASSEAIGRTVVGDEEQVPTSARDAQ
jgi:alkylmercury lyase